MILIYFGPGVEKVKQFFRQILNDFSTRKSCFFSDFGVGVDKSKQFFRKTNERFFDRKIMILWVILEWGSRSLNIFS